MRPVRVLGVDACRTGWVALTDDGYGYAGADIETLVAEADQDSPLAVVAIDIPIGIPRDTERAADRLVRPLIGRRASSVFSTPVRSALFARTHAEGSELNRRATGKGMTRQAYGLAKRIDQVDVWIRAGDRVGERVVIEVHPEFCFATIAGDPLTYPKWSWAGVEERRRLLTAVGIDVPTDLGPAGEGARVDDVLDAAVASWTARRFADGLARSYPDPPERYDDGPVAATWV